jgi:hypothetical protein
MTEFFASPDDLGEPRASELQSSLGESLGSQAATALGSGVGTLARIGDYNRAEHGDWTLAGQVGRIHDRIAAGEDPGVVAQTAADQSATRAYSPTVLPLADAQARLKEQGLDGQVKLPDQPTIKAPVLDLMIADAHERVARDAAVRRGPQGFLPDALGLATSLGAGMIDPVNLAAFSIPVLGEARWGKIMESAGGSILGRTGVRLMQGAAQGAVGGAAIAPSDWWLHTLDGRDYTMADALHSVLMSAGMGAAFHAGLGGVGDLTSRLRGRPLAGSPDDLTARGLLPEPAAPAPGEAVRSAVDEEVPGITPESQTVHGDALEQLRSGGLPEDEAQARHPAEILADLPPRAQEDVVRAAAADMIEDRPVRASELLNAAATVDPRIAESLNGPGPEEPTATIHMGPKAARGPRAKDAQHYSLLEFLAARGGLKPNGELATIFGGKPKFVPGFGPLLRKAGMTLDHAREAAVEAGYITDAGAIEGREADSSINQLLDLVDQEARGSQVYRGDQAPPETKGAAAARVQERQAHYDNEFAHALDEVGIDRKSVPDKTWSRVLQIMDKEHVGDPLEAYERAVMEDSHNGQEIGQGGRTEQHIPGWDVPDDAGATSGGRAAAAADGTDGSRPAARQSGEGDRAADWRSLADARRAVDDPDALAESKEAAATPEPASIDPTKTISAAEAAAKQADDLWKEIEPTLSEHERDQFNEVLQNLDREKADRENIIREGAACLAAAVA